MNTSSSVDLVVVGAGAAGLATARIARELGLNFVVFEAMDRIGGRAHTDRLSRFGTGWRRRDDRDGARHPGWCSRR